jgi:TolB protein
VFDDFEDVYTMRPDGTDVVDLTAEAGSEFDGAWSPDGQLVAYRDSRRGINEDDEIYVVRADGTGARNVSNDPANDWGPDWSPDGQWIVFNSDRGGGALGGYVVRPDGSDLEYPTFSPDGTRVAFMSHVGSDYDIFVADVTTGDTTRLTDAGGSDGWPAWSPDGTTIAFASERFVAWSPDGRHLLISGRALFVVRPDGTGRLELRADGFPLALGGIPDWTG